MAPPVTRVVRLLSSLHSERMRMQQETVSAFFSPEHFPKFLATGVVVSGIAGYWTMHALRKMTEDVSSALGGRLLREVPWRLFDQALRLAKHSPRGV